MIRKLRELQYQVHASDDFLLGSGEVTVCGWRGYKPSIYIKQRRNFQRIRNQRSRHRTDS